jgi:hypothetical protein
VVFLLVFILVWAGWQAMLLHRELWKSFLTLAAAG